MRYIGASILMKITIILVYGNTSLSPEYMCRTKPLVHTCLRDCFYSHNNQVSRSYFGSVSSYSPHFLFLSPTVARMRTVAIILFPTYVATFAMAAPITIESMYIPYG